MYDLMISLVISRAVYDVIVLTQNETIQNQLS